MTPDPPGSVVALRSTQSEPPRDRQTRLGVLDIGSNSAQLQIVDLRRGGPPLPAYAVKHPTLLGDANSDDGGITPAGVERVVDAARQAIAAARAHQVDAMYAFATAAIRDAVLREGIMLRYLQDVQSDGWLMPLHDLRPALLPE